MSVAVTKDHHDQRAGRYQGKTPQPDLVKQVAKNELHAMKASSGCGISREDLTRESQVEVKPDAAQQARHAKRDAVKSPCITLTAMGGSRTEMLNMQGKVARYDAKIMIDSGATGMFISEQFISKTQLRTVPCTEHSIKLADGTAYKCNRMLHPDLTLSIGPYRRVLSPLYVIPLHDQYDVILGMNWLELENPRIDWRKKTVTFDHLPNFDLCSVTLNAAEEKDEFSFLMSAEELLKEYEAGTVIHLASIKLSSDNFPDENEDPEFAGLMAKLVMGYPEVFPEELPAELPPDRLGISHRIELVPDAKLFSTKLYKHSYLEKAELEKTIRMLLQKGLISACQSPVASPVLFVKKKDGSLRMCIDYRALNNITVKNKCPLPLIEALFQQVDGEYYTSIDLMSGYWQLPVEEKDRWKTAFIVEGGRMYQWHVMPFGLCNAPSSFQELMNNVFSDYIGKFMVVYLDDILIFSKTKEEHLEHVRLVLERLRQHRLYGQLKKSVFGKRRVKWLGHIISGKGIEVDGSKVEAINNWPVPKNVGQLHSFLGLAGYYRKFIEKFAEKAAPLTNMTKKNVPWLWGPAQQTAFDQLKHALVTAPVLVLPSPDFPFVMHTDASESGIGGVLMQDQGKGLQVIGYWSRKWRPNERNWGIYDKELQGLLYGLEVNRHLLHGQHMNTAYTDQRAITYIATQKTLSSRQARMQYILSEYNMHVQYIDGKSNKVADALSRKWTKDEPLELNAIATALRMSPEWLITVKVSYDSDAFSKQLLELINTNTTKKFELVDGLITRVKDGFHRLYIPDSGTLRKDLLQDFHDSYLAGHVGADKTYELISRYYYWPKMVENVREYVKSCPVCVVSKSSNHKPYGKLQPIDIPTRKLKVWSMDLITHLGETADGFDAVITLTDKLTKYLCVYPITIACDARDVADKVYKRHFTMYGIAETIVTDRDPRWVSKFFSTLTKLAGVKMNLSSGYHPESNGQAERSNRTVEDALRCYCQAHGGQWSDHLQAVVSTINNSKNFSTGFSPNQLVFGQNMDLVPTLNHSKLGDSYNQAAVDYLEQYKADLELARKNLLQAQARQQRYADRFRQGLELEVGQKVLLSTANLKPSETARKLSPKKCGPFKVLERIGKNAYRLELPAQMKRVHPVFNVAMLEPYYESARYTTEDRMLRPGPLDYLDLGEDVFLVEKLLDMKTERHGRQNILKFLVKWQGYPSYENTWEPESSMLGFDVKKMVADLKQRKKAQHSVVVTAAPQRRSAKQRQ